MPSFEVGRTISSTTPSMAVSAGMPEGTYLFRLEVVDSAGLVSLPSYASVRVYSVITKPGFPKPLPLPDPSPAPEPETM